MEKGAPQCGDETLPNISDCRSERALAQGPPCRGLKSIFFSCVRKENRFHSKRKERQRESSDSLPLDTLSTAKGPQAGPLETLAFARRKGRGFLRGTKDDRRRTGDVGNNVGQTLFTLYAGFAERMETGNVRANYVYRPIVPVRRGSIYPGEKPSRRGI